MREGLQLKLPRHAAPQLGNLRKRHLAGENHPRGPQSRVLLGGRRAHDRRLRGDVHRHPRRKPARQRNGTEVGHDHRVYAGLYQKREERRQRVCVLVGHDRVHGHVDRNAPRVRVGHRLDQLLVREVPASGTHTPVLASQIDRICAKVDSLAQLLRATRRRQELHVNLLAHR